MNIDIYNCLMAYKKAKHSNQFSECILKELQKQKVGGAEFDKLVQTQINSLPLVDKNNDKCLQDDSESNDTAASNTDTNSSINSQDSDGVGDVSCDAQSCTEKPLQRTRSLCHTNGT